MRLAVIVTDRGQGRHRGSEQDCPNELLGDDAEGCRRSSGVRLVLAPC